MNFDQAFSHSYPAVARSVPRARRALTMFAGATGTPPEQVEAVRLAVSEALTNAVLHAYGEDETGSVHVSAARSGSKLTITIADDGSGLRALGQSSGLGMGLGLIACMSEHFAMSRRPEGGTEVEMRFGAGAGRRAGSAAMFCSAIPA